TFVKDPHSIVKAGQVVKVKVLEVDLQRQRIALTMRMGDEPTQRQRSDNAPASRGQQHTSRPRPGGSSNYVQQRSSTPAPSGNAMAAAFAKLKR
ncbi:MAG: S1 RNA-binding domain-containing protein, partial [Azonexus sp.]